MASIVYNTFKGKDGNDWAAGAASAYKWMLVTSSYTPNPDHDFVSDVVSNEVSGGSYARQNIAGRSKAVDDTNNKYTHSADNPTFALSSASPKYLIGYRAVTNDSDHQLVCCLDLGSPGTGITGDFIAKIDGGASSGVAFENA